jgi:hypothetical protein
MISNWKINNSSKEAEYFILFNDAIWVSTINENELSIEQAYEQNQLFGKTDFYRFSEIGYLVFENEKNQILIKFLPETDRKPVKINFTSQSNFSDTKKVLEQNLRRSDQKPKPVGQKSIPIITAILTTIGIIIFLYLTSEISQSTLLILVVLTIIEIIVLGKFFKGSKKENEIRVNG